MRGERRQQPNMVVTQASMGHGRDGECQRFVAPLEVDVDFVADGKVANNLLPD